MGSAGMLGLGTPLSARIRFHLQWELLTWLDWGWKTHALDVRVFARPLRLTNVLQGLFVLRSNVPGFVGSAFRMFFICVVNVLPKLLRSRWGDSETRVT